MVFVEVAYGVNTTNSPLNNAKINSGLLSLF
ncbi:MAG: hypothetical protein ACI88H_002201, partial [Cocleimonas sp.]